ncbi:MAG: type I restriction enzyme HsdR N-terminal domain-containing protein [Desulfobacterales bacterium]
MTGHHLILGELTDFITGETLADTLDERYRQNLARLLIEKKGYAKSEVHPRRPLTARAGRQRAELKIDLVVTLGERLSMIVRFGPGSIVTRHRSALAASRLLEPYQVPVVVVTNGENADVLDGSTGRVIGRGLEELPDRPALLATLAAAAFEPVSAHRAEVESRILYAYEVDGACPCDDTICRL